MRLAKRADEFREVEHESTPPPAETDCPRTGRLRQVSLPLRGIAAAGLGNSYL
jgi:hypothetical protein